MSSDISVSISTFMHTSSDSCFFYKSVDKKNDKICTASPLHIVLTLITPTLCFSALQAYTSQFVALIMFALLMCDDRISVQPRRREIIQGLRVLPGKSSHEYAGSAREILIPCKIETYRDGKPALGAKIKRIQKPVSFLSFVQTILLEEDAKWWERERED